MAAENRVTVPVSIREVKAILRTVQVGGDILGMVDEQEKNGLSRRQATHGCHLVCNSDGFELEGETGKDLADCLAYCYDVEPKSPLPVGTKCFSVSRDHLLAIKIL